VGRFGFAFPTSTGLRRVVLIVLIAAAIGVIALGPRAWRRLRLELRIDACLDSGGRWDYAAGKCER
jgi:hypothetical protein